MFQQFFRKIFSKKFSFSFLLALGASITLGFLSFAGVLTIPFLAYWPIGVAAFFLSTVYEGQIFYQNLAGAYDKLFSKNHLKQELSDQFLEQLIEDKKNLNHCEFLRSYREQSRYVKALSRYENLDKEGNNLKEKAELRLQMMQQYFMRFMFNLQTNDSNLCHELRSVISSDEQKQLVLKAKKRRRGYWGIFAFSNVVGASVALATITSMAESLGSISILAMTAATTTALIFPAAGLAAAAYTFLFYNAITDFWHNNRVQQAKDTILNVFNESTGLKSVGLAIGVGIVIVLGVGLTIATAGTWWTLSKGVVDVLPVLAKLPSLITVTLIPVISAAVYSAASLIFNLENTQESIELLQKIQFKKKFKEGIDKFLQANPNENKWQRYNPLRIIIQTITLPIRVLSFIGHVGSIGATTDKVAFIPQKLSAITAGWCTTNELLEDLHYFADEDDEDEHAEHNIDLPSVIIKTILLPLHLLSAIVDSVASQKNRQANRLNYKQALFRSLGIKTSVLPQHLAPKMIPAWLREERYEKISQEIDRLQSSKVAMREPETKQKVKVLQKLRSETRAMSISGGSAKSYPQLIDRVLSTKSDDAPTFTKRDVLGLHRNTFFSPFRAEKLTRTDEFIQSLSSDNTGSFAESHTLPSAACAA